MTDWVTVYDSVNVAAIPADAKVILGYVDGSDPEIAGNYAAVVKRFPHAHIVSVTTTGRNPAMMCDCEKYDLTPAMVRTWALRRLYSGPWPLVYSNVSTKPSIFPEMVGIPWSWWAADWTGTPHLVPDSSATQYANPATSGGDYDVSIMLPALFQYLFPKPATPTRRKVDMILINNGVTQYVLCSDGTKVPVDDPADLAALATVLPGSVTLSPSQVDLFPTK